MRAGFKIRNNVALRKESVDRNRHSFSIKRAQFVALRKESVDRNSAAANVAWCVVVALRKESVDRNCTDVQIIGLGQQSLSARRAWIEMLHLV